MNKHPCIRDRNGRVVSWWCKLRNRWRSAVLLLRIRQKTDKMEKTTVKVQNPKYGYLQLTLSG